VTEWTKRALTALALIGLLVAGFTLEAAASVDGTRVAQADGAQTPFGTRTPPSAAPAPSADPGPFSKFWNWIQQTQQQLYRELADGVRTLKQERAFSSGLALVLISFFYGIVHAIGPGHGKAVISSYALANERTARRGIMLAFGASFVQALSAIALVGVMAIILNAAGVRIRERVGELETLSYALVAVVGAVMLIAAVRRFWRRRAHPRVHAHDHAHDDDCGCGHAHMPDPQTLQSSWSWRSAAAIMLAVGVRPCTGAIVVLVFALTQGLFWAGILATFAMSMGTALTVSVLAAAAVGSREVAARAGGSGTVWAQRVQTFAALGGGFVVMILGVLLFAASLGPARPF
jgi:nickel/cobalt transporter (NicO) family protein